MPFPTAARWAGIRFYGDTDRGVKVYCPFGEVEHPDHGREPALRIYPDHGWCFAEQRYFSSVSLLAEVWEVSWQDAAVKALDEIGYVPADYAHLWENAQRVVEPDREALATALIMFCGSHCQGWTEAQYDEQVSEALAKCLGLLRLVQTEEDCRRWLEASKVYMGRCLPGK